MSPGPVPTAADAPQPANNGAARKETDRLRPDELLSVAALCGAPVLNPEGQDIGRVVDLVARWHGETYPPVVGLVVRIGRRQAYLPSEQAAEITTRQVRLHTAAVALVDFRTESDEIRLAREVIDHQLVDVDGRRVVRASDLYLAGLPTGMRLVGVEVGIGPLVRRIGPRARLRPSPRRVVDWSQIQAFDRAGRDLRLARPHARLHLLRPVELATLLEQLEHQERQELLAAVGPAAAAAAVEEMPDEAVADMLRSLTPDQAAVLVAGMAPDEAADALRGLEGPDRRRVLAALPPSVGSDLEQLARHPRTTAGGMMTTTLRMVTVGETIGQIVDGLRSQPPGKELGGVVVVDDAGQFVDDLSIEQVLVSPPDTPVRGVVADQPALTVQAHDDHAAILRTMRANRRSSVVVVGGDRRPLGRVTSTQLLDAIVGDRKRPRPQP